MVQEVTVDDIFAELKKVNSEKSHPEKSKADLKTLEKQISTLPSISKVDLANTGKKHSKYSEVPLKIDDPIEAVLPKKGSNIRQDKTAIKKQKSEEWFSLPKVELTEDLKRELSLIKYRQYLDPKRFYKKDKWVIPERFQMGTIVGGPTDYYNRISRKKRGKGFVEELLKDKDANMWFKKTYRGIQVEKTSGGKNYYKKLREKRRAEHH